MFKQVAVTLSLFLYTSGIAVIAAEAPMLKGFVEAQTQPPAEHCACVNAAQVQAVEVNGQWQLQEADKPLLELRTKDAADAALRVIQTYAVTDICSLGTPTNNKFNPQSIYFKTREGAPAAALANEDAIGFDNVTVRAEQRQGSWKLVTPDDTWLLDFGSDEAAARNAADIVRYYGFNKQCFVGAPAREMMYWHR